LAKLALTIADAIQGVPNEADKLKEIQERFLKDNHQSLRFFKKQLGIRKTMKPLVFFNRILSAFYLVVKAETTCDVTFMPMKESLGFDIVSLVHETT